MRFDHVLEGCSCLQGDIYAFELAIHSLASFARINK